MIAASDLTGVIWTKSGRSASVANCVEVAAVNDGVVIRNSKRPEEGAMLFTRAEFEAFLGGVRDGNFDLI